MEKYYMISEKDLKHLLKAELDLRSLQCNGVDNWSGYGEDSLEFLSLITGESEEELLEKDCDYDEIIDEIVNNDIKDYDEIPEEIDAILGSENLDYMKEQFSNYIKRLNKEMKGNE